jgi:hypothetical protein
MQSENQWTRGRVLEDDALVVAFQAWEVWLRINKAVPNTIIQDQMRSDQRQVFNPMIQAADPNERFLFDIVRHQQNVNFLWAAGLIRRIKDPAYSAAIAARVVSGCSDCLTIFAGARPGDHLGHRISEKFSKAVRLNITEGLSQTKFKDALIGLIKEGGWVSPDSMINLVPQVRWVDCQTPHSGRKIADDEICYFSDCFLQDNDDPSPSEIRKAKHVANHLLGIFNR